MRLTTQPALLHLGGSSRLSALALPLALPLALAGCFVDEAPESGDGGSSMTNASTTEVSASSTSASVSSSTGTQGSDTADTTATTTATTATATATMTMPTDGTTVTTGDTASTGSSTTTTTGVASDSDATTDPSGTTTTTTGGDPCEGLELSLAMTEECVVGESLENQGMGHEICAEEFGVAWRWLEFHDGEAIGWTAFGVWETPVGAGERGWVWIDDNTGQCWDSNRGMTWYRPEGDSCKAGCAPATGLEGDDYDPLPGKCNPYDGDTPCELCRRLICVKG